MVKTEKYKEELLFIVYACQKINAGIGEYKAHYLTSDMQFSVELDNGILKVPIYLAAHPTKLNSNQSAEILKKIAGNFKIFNKKQRTYKKILADWHRLFSNPRNSSDLAT